MSSFHDDIATSLKQNKVVRIKKETWDKIYEEFKALEKTVEHYKNECFPNYAAVQVLKQQEQEYEAYRKTQASTKPKSR